MEKDDIDVRKRARSANYTEREKELLFSLVFKYKNIIENKRTDGVTVQEKKQVWEKVALQFNSASPGMVPRTPESLKKFYENKKKVIRKDMAKERCELYKTGGGPAPSTIANPKKNVILSIINPKSVFGLNNDFDGDRLAENTQVNVSYPVKRL